MNSFSIQSFGCRVNQAEAFSWADEFQRRGLHFNKDHLSSDLILINTCTITSRADRDVRNFLRRVHRENPGARLVVTGCMAERAAEELRGFPGVWRVVSNLEKESLPARILTPLPEEPTREQRAFRSRALVKIQDGCDFSCTFCIVPSVRGKSVSFPRDRILVDVRVQIRQGFREVVLAGVHLTLYGRDLSPPATFLSLLKDICGLPGLHRLRLTSLDPRFMDQDLIDFLVSEPKICPHFHLSLQHGSDRIIARMGRKITSADYGLILERLRAGLPHAALGTDIIVGFPGETGEDFDIMEGFLASSPLTYFHVFTFSPRPGTPAASWKQVPPEVKKDRAKRLRALARGKNLRFRRSFEGTTCEAVVISREPEGRTRVLTDHYIDVILPECPVPEKALASIEITEAAESETRGMFKARDQITEE